MSKRFEGLVIGSLDNVVAVIKRVAPTNSTILIQGESGTGKELVAKAIHSQSQRKDKPFVAINCGALPEGTIESELFGHVKGAYTGAHQETPGLFGHASEGTAFLDEISEMPPQAQVKLLRVLESGQYHRVGDEKLRQTNARVIVATNQNLKAMVESGKFRHDLYYRINVVPVEIPPLRERKQDIQELIDYFIEMYLRKDTGIEGQIYICSTQEEARTKDGTIILVEQAVRDALLRYDWPGNVRELENVIERAVIMCEDHTIKVTDLPSNILKEGLLKHLSTLQNQELYDGLVSYMRLFEIKLSELVEGVKTAALRSTGGNKSEAAELLGINRSTLYSTKKLGENKK